MRALQTLKVEAQEREREVWADELVARRYEAVFIEFWDRLNRSENALALVAEFPIGNIVYRGSETTAELEHQIQRGRLDGEANVMSATEWQAQAGAWIEGGWILEFQECRQSGFDLSNRDSPRSIFDLVAHLRRESPEGRGILRGQLGVSWQSGPGTAPPQVREIEVIQGEWIFREGGPVFQEIVSRDMMPHTATRFIDPLIVADFDENGRSDLLFSGCNVLYSGIEGGGLRSETYVLGSNPVVYTSLYADVTGDGKRDYLIVDRRGVMMVPGGGDRQRLVHCWKAPMELKNPSAMTAGDVDGDGDLDLWVVQYKMPYVAGQMPTPFYDANDGFPSFLLINNGAGTFLDQTEQRGLGEWRYRRTYSSSFIDLDGDADLDLLNVSDFAGLDLFRNDGTGHFTRANSDWVDATHGFGMAHAFGDFDLSGAMDFIMIGMNSSVADRLDSLGLWPKNSGLDSKYRAAMAFGNRLYTKSGARYIETGQGKGIARAGWAWGVGTLDFDNDGDLDLYVANGHKTRASTRDYEEQFWCHDLYVGTSEENPTLDLHFRKVGTDLYGAGYSYGGYQRNAFFLNLKGKEFVEVAYLMGIADDEDGRNVVCEDLDLDGLVDIVVTASEVWPQSRQAFRLYQNLVVDSGGWIGFRLANPGSGRNWLGAEVRVETTMGAVVPRLVTSGDGYRTQAAGALHFGLGRDASVEKVTIRFSDGELFEFPPMAVGKYHDLRLP